MATVVLNIMSVAFPSITNRLRASVYLQSDPQAFVASQIDAIAGHPKRVWSFPGLPRNNYGWALDEIDGADALVQRIAFFDVVPSEIDGSLTRDYEQIEVDVTPGLVSGVNNFTFDGTETSVGSGIFKPDYRGWEILISEYGGVGFLIKDVLDFSWDSSLGLFTLLSAGAVLANGQWYTVEFVPQENTQGNSYPTVTDFTIRLLTATGNILSSDFGNEIIVEPADTYIELSLPPILTVPQGRKLMVHFSPGIDSCSNFLSVDAPITFLRGKLLACPNESFSVYRYKRPDDSNEWRVSDCDGNFKTVGQVVGDDSTASNVFNKYPLNGDSIETLRYARLYYEIVLNLPPGQVVDYDSWSGDVTKYSLDNSSNPSAQGHFHVPDRTNCFEQNGDGTNAGNFASGQVGEFTDDVVIPLANTSIGMVGTGKITSGNEANEPTDLDPIHLTFNAGKENYPTNYLINKYVLF